MKFLQLVQFLNWAIVICSNIYIRAYMQIWMTLFQFAQMVLIVPKFEWSSSNYPNMIKAVGICPVFLNVCNFKWSGCILFKLEWSCLKLPKIEWRCSTWPEDEWSCCCLSRVDLVCWKLLKLFPIHGNVFNFTQIWIKLSQFAQILLRLLKLIFAIWLLFSRWFGYYFALIWKIDTTSLTQECSCILSPNFENFCPNNGQFFSVGDATASPASPFRTLMDLIITFSDSLDLIFNSRDPNRVPKTP